MKIPHTLAKVAAKGKGLGILLTKNTMPPTKTTAPEKGRENVRIITGGKRWKSFLKHALQQLDLITQRGILVEGFLDLADGVEHGGVIPAAEPAADFRQ